MFVSCPNDQPEVYSGIFELNAEEQEHVAGGPEQPNDPGQ